MDICKTTPKNLCDTNIYSTELEGIDFNLDAYTHKSSTIYAAQVAQAHMGLSPQPDVSILQLKPVSPPTQDEIGQAAKAARSHMGLGVCSRSMNQYEDDDTQELRYGLGEMQEVGEREGEEEDDEDDIGIFLDEEGYDSYS